LDYTRTLALQLDCDKAVFYGNTVPSQDLWKEAGFPRYLQAGEGLGHRMEQAFQWGFKQGYKRIIIIGSDCAELNRNIIMTAFEALGHHDFVLGPAKDGGYYLLGMKSLLSQLFHHKKWSTSSVAADTLADIQKANKSVHLLPTLSDIDTIEDLAGTFLEDLA